MNNSNGNNSGNIDFKMKTAEFRGYTVKALEDINKELTELKVEIKETNIRMEKLNGRLSLLQGKVAGIGAVAGLVASAVVHYLLI